MPRNPAPVRAASPTGRHLPRTCGSGDGLCTGHGDEISKADLRSAARSHRHPHIVLHVLSGIEVPRVDYEKLSGDRLGESSTNIRARIQAARNIQRNRFTNPDSRGTDIVCPVLEPGPSQCGHARGRGAEVLQTGRRRHRAELVEVPEPDAFGHGAVESFGARLSPHPEAGAHDRRPGRERGDPICTSGRGFTIPPQSPFLGYCGQVVGSWGWTCTPSVGVECPGKTPGCCANAGLMPARPSEGTAIPSENQNGVKHAIAPDL